MSLKKCFYSFSEINNLDFLRKHIGPLPVSYLMNINFNQINEIKYDELTNIQKKTLSYLSEEIKDFEKSQISLGHTFENNPSLHQKMHRFDFVKPIRQINGGQTLEKTSADPLLNCLLKIGREYYIKYLMSVRDRFPPMISLSPFIEKKCVELIRNDKIVSKIFKDINDINTSSIQYNFSSGVSFSTQLMLLCPTLLYHAFEITFYRGDFSLEAFYLSIKDSYDCLVNFLQIGELNTFAYFGLNGISINSRITISDDLTIYPIVEEHLQHFQWSNISHLNRTDNKGKKCFDDSILEMRVKIKNYPSRNDTYKEAYKKWQEKIDLLFNKIILSGVLFANENDYGHDICPHMSWYSVLNPINSSGMGTVGTRTNYKFLKIYSDNEKSKFIRIFNKVKDFELNSIKIAIDRFISALTRRHDPVDKFIDIMVALENLFGLKLDISENLSKSIAVLLKDNINDPLAKKIKKHYDYRSKIIHGSQRYTFKEIHEFNEFSLKILKDCLICLLTNRFDLLPLNSNKRVKKLIPVNQSSKRSC